jgi:hypothetical protein
MDDRCHFSYISKLREKKPLVSTTTHLTQISIISPHPKQTSGPNFFITTADNSYFLPFFTAGAL